MPTPRSRRRGRHTRRPHTPAHIIRIWVRVGHARHVRVPWVGSRLSGCYCHDFHLLFPSVFSWRWSSFIESETADGDHTHSFRTRRESDGSCLRVASLDLYSLDLYSPVVVVVNPSQGVDGVLVGGNSRRAVGCSHGGGRLVGGPGRGGRRVAYGGVPGPRVGGSRSGEPWLWGPLVAHHWVEMCRVMLGHRVACPLPHTTPC